MAEKNNPSPGLKEDGAEKKKKKAPRQGQRLPADVQKGAVCVIVQRKGQPLQFKTFADVTGARAYVAAQQGGAERAAIVTVNATFRVGE